MLIETDDKFALKTEIPEDVDLSNYYTKNETYTKTETYDKFALKERTYTKSECDGLFAYRNDTYTKPQCDMKYVNNDNYVIFTLGNRLDGRCTLNSVCYGNNMFVTVGFEGICAWSRNGNMYTKGQLVIMFGKVFVMEIICLLL